MIYRIVDILTGLFESIVAYMLFNHYMDKRETIPKFVYYIGIIFVTIGINLSNYIFSFSFFNTVFIVSLFVMFAFMFQSSIRTRVLWAVISITISACSEVIVLLFLSVIKHVGRTEIYLNPQLRILGIILSKGLNFAIIRIICSFGRKTYVKTDTNYWFLFSIVFTVVLSTIYLIFNPQPSVKAPYMAVFCAVGLLYGVFAALYLYERMTKQAKQIKEEELLKQQQETQINHLNDLVLAQEKLRSFKHDFSNHMLSLKSYFDSENYNEGNKYLQNLIDEVDLQSDRIDTGNIVIDAIITAKRDLARKKDIRFEISIKIPSNINISSSDCCVIFGNALDNAIEAADKLHVNKYIKVNAAYHNNTLSCKIINSTLPQSDELKTTKSDKENHGIGINNIKKVLEKYKNLYRFEYENNEFVFSFIIYNI